MLDLDSIFFVCVHFLKKLILLTPLPPSRERTSFCTMWHNSRISGSSVFMLLSKGSNTDLDWAKGGIWHLYRISALKKVLMYYVLQFTFEISNQFQIVEETNSWSQVFNVVMYIAHTWYTYIRSKGSVVLFVLRIYSLPLQYEPSIA